MAMRYNRLTVLLGAMLALGVMTCLSGWWMDCWDFVHVSQLVEVLYADASWVCLNVPLSIWFCTVRPSFY